MIDFNEDLDIVEAELNNFPLSFLNALAFRLDCLIKERDTGYQRYLEGLSTDQKTPERVKLTLVQTTLPQERKND